MLHHRPVLSRSPLDETGGAYVLSAFFFLISHSLSLTLKKRTFVVFVPRPKRKEKVFLFSSLALRTTQEKKKCSSASSHPHGGDVFHQHLTHLLLVRLDGGVDPTDGTLGVGAHSLARLARVAALLLNHLCCCCCWGKGKGLEKNSEEKKKKITTGGTAAKREW